MDSRDIKEEPSITSGFLDSMYDMQKYLINEYAKIEGTAKNGMPSYPVDVNTKSSQVLLKDFTSRIIEELSEGFESFENVNELVKSKGSNLNLFSGKEYTQLCNALQNGNEEIADAIHFFLELLIYVNIEPEDIESYLKKFTSDVFGPQSVYYSSDELLSQLMWNGYRYLIKTESIPYELIPRCHCIDLTEMLDSDSGLNRLVKAGSKYHQTNYELNYGLISWQITHHLNIARNFLKNKPWKQSQVMTQELRYQAELMKSFTIFCGYLYVLGLEAEDVYYIYFKKNHVNQFRIKSKY